MTGARETIRSRVEVELDIFSGMPNPTWILTSDEADRFVKQVAVLQPIAARERSGNLGYRGFIVHVTHGAHTQSIRIQTGIVEISKAGTSSFADDRDRRLERWLLNTGRPHLKNEIFQIVERELR